MPLDTTGKLFLAAPQLGPTAKPKAKCVGSVDYDSLHDTWGLILFNDPSGDYNVYKLPGKPGYWIRRDGAWEYLY